ncbi:MAG: hypothetical protein ACTSVI_03410, partial [Promethearchaeota archaeon]
MMSGGVNSKFPRDPIWFAYNLVVMLRNCEEALIKPSSRQMIAIPRMILARCIRNGEIEAEDYVDIAVATSPPENQDAARKIAFRLLNPYLTKKLAVNDLINTTITPLDELESTFTDFSQNMDDLTQILNELEMIKQFSRTDGENLMNLKDIKLDPASEDDLENFFNRIKDEPYHSAVNLLGGLNSILGKNITSETELINRAKELVQENIGALT